MRASHSGQSDTDAVDACSLEQLADRIGEAITRMMAVLEQGGVDIDGNAAEGVVRCWISRLEPEARAQFLTLVLSQRGHRHSARIGRAILRGEAWPLTDEPRRHVAGGQLSMQ